jgi:A/G-specific adenine glycosylase
VAHATGRTAELPVRKPKKAQKEKQAVMLVLTHGGQVLLEQRPESGIWGGLLSLPELDGMRAVDDDAEDGTPTLDAAFPEVRLMAERFGLVDEVEALAPFSHVFTHFKLNVLPVHFRLGSLAPAVAESRHVWLAQQGVADAPLPAPVKKLLQAMFAPGLWA